MLNKIYFFFHTWLWLGIHFLIVVIVSYIDQADSLTSTASLTAMSWVLWVMKCIIFPIDPQKIKRK